MLNIIFSKDPAVESLRVDVFESGEGTSAQDKPGNWKNYHIGSRNTREECLSDCYKRKLSDKPKTNGASYGVAGGREKRCLCEEDMSERTGGNYVSSYFVFKGNFC